MDRWLRIKQAAEYIGTTPGFIKAKIREGKLWRVKAGKRYLIDRADLDALLENLKRTIKPRSRRLSRVA